MFDIGWSELLVIAVVAIVVVGPRELPGMLRTFGKYAAQLRRMAGDFQTQFNEALKEAELDDVRKSIESVRSVNPMNQIRDSLNPLKDAGESLRKAVEEPAAPKPDSKSEPKPEVPKAAVNGATGDTAPKPAAAAKRAEEAAKVAETKKSAAAKGRTAAKKPATAKKPAAPRKPKAEKPAGNGSGGSSSPDTAA